GVCQHILTAVLFLQQTVPANTAEQLPGVAAAEVPAAPEQELMVITAEQLENWAGKAAFKSGLKLASEFTPEIQHRRAIPMRFSTLNTEVRFIPGGGLDGMIVSGGKGDGRPVIVAAIIGFQRAQGKDWAIPAGVSTLEASAGAPRSRAEVLDACQTLLDDTLG